MRESGETILKELLSREEERTFASPDPMPAPASASTEESTKQGKENHVQWALGGNRRYMPVGQTVPILPAGVYEPFAGGGIWGVEGVTITSDHIYPLPDMATEIVLQEACKFWASEERYRQHKLLYKRGLLLWGPPGGGKTVAIKLLMNELIQRGGIILLANNIALTILCLKAIRRIEPTHNLILVLEDIDEIIHQIGESSVLSLLDGEHNIDNILQIATTNHPEVLGARIVNRPSRFDRRIYVGMPEEAARRVYLEKVTSGGLPEEQLKKWVSDTKTMSIAHLRELVAAVYCLEQPYEETLERLKHMAAPVKNKEDGFKSKDVGFMLYKVPGQTQKWLETGSTIDSL